MKLQPSDVTAYLRRNEVTVHLVQTDSAGNLTVFLEAALNQRVVAETLLSRLPGVMRTRYSAPGIVRVIVNPIATDPNEI